MALRVKDVVWAAAEWPLAAALFSYSRLVEKTARWSTVGTPPARPAILVNFHHHQPLMQVVQRGNWMMVSRAPELRPVARYCRWMGVHTARGSSGEGGRQALSELSQALRRRESVSIAVDGPRGPAYKAKRGCVLLAQETGAPIVPVSYHCARGIRSPRWDQALFATPFDRIIVCYGAPLDVAGLSEKDALDRVDAALLEGMRDDEGR